MSRHQLRAAIAVAADILAQAGIDTARTDAELLAAHAAGTERGRLTLLERTTPEFLERFQEAVAERAKRVPLQHITGTTAFGPVQLQVGPGVFIPRPETEALLEWSLRQALPDNPVIVDLCTGSGALAIALAAHLPGATVIGVDDDPAALEYARRNAATTTVQLITGDATDPRLLPELIGTVDLVVANPPYIPRGAILDPEVSRHDPARALFGGDDGMSVITPVVHRAADWLKADGLLAVEHDDTTSAACVATVEGVGAFTEVTAHRDLTGRPRFVTARRAR
jgi:release factor glutamine methyltransferase